MATPGVRYIPLDEIPLDEAAGSNKLPFSAAWARDSQDAVRDEMLATLREGLESYVEQA